VFVLLPLFLISGVIEGFVTPLLANTFFPR
jgi:uncharacterized membrane protein SpoIIM required for sporulation